jgi:CheY-like chemotaxis protein
MVLRYVKGLNPQAVADQLSIGLRHYYRVHKSAIADVAGILKERFVGRELMSEEMDQAIEEKSSLSRLELLRLEAVRTIQADRYTHIGDVVDGVFSLLREVLHQHGLELQTAIPRALPGVSIDRSLLRQMLLGMLGYLIERAEESTIRLEAQTEGTAVDLSLQVEPSKAVRATGQAETDERLAALEEMAVLAGAHILPTYVGSLVVGFDVQMPTVQHTVLAVDDNEDVLELIRGYLSPHGYRVITAQTAQDALNRAATYQPYAITLDLMMPEQDGWQVLQTLLNQPDTDRIPIIVCSVLRQKELALSLGAVAFVEKPITEQALLSALDALEET